MDKVKLGGRPPGPHADRRDTNRGNPHRNLGRHRHEVSIQEFSGHQVRLPLSDLTERVVPLRRVLPGPYPVLKVYPSGSLSAACSRW